jgi:myxalamid-type polyketide synthase MxaE and MxaD
MEPIAIIGMSCRFPKAENAEAFWKLLLNGEDAIAPIPQERWQVDDYYDADPTAPGKTNQRHAAMLERIHDFDPFFFNISPAEATQINPSQKLMLELVWEAMENAGIPAEKLTGTKAGVYVGNIWSDFEHLRKHKNATVTSHSAVGQSSNIIANRISYTFGLRGPSLVMDTGCSSSLVAVHLACQSIWEGSSEWAVAGAVNHILDPDQYILLTKFGGLSAKGRCSTFDAGGDGFVRGEGAGVVLLKKLSDAERDGDHILAVIRGSAINNNGFNASLPATSVQGQEELLRETYRMAGILPHEVHYVEAHGTGTRLGDPTETKALGGVLGVGRDASRKLALGSVKTNIGHLEAAAGIAGMIKVLLAMQRRVLPASLNFRTPNPNIPFDAMNLRVQAQAGPWPTVNGETLKAGINSFGWGGTNAHVVLEEYRPAKKDHPAAAPARSTFLLPLSARTEGALRAYAGLYQNYLREHAADAGRLGQVCAATAALKSGFEYRLVLHGTDAADLAGQLGDFLGREESLTPIRKEAPKVVFIFPGQGSQWIGMGRALYASEPVFRAAIDACDAAFRPYTDWSLVAELHADAPASRFKEINVIQPSICAIQIALARLWRSWGVEPQAVVGHSMGEVAASCTAGALSLDDAARIICLRSQLMRKLSGKGGAMAVTELSVAQAEQIVARYPGKLSVAVSNSPKSTVIAGDQAAITEVLAGLESQGLFCRQVKVDVASHSQQMDPLKDELRAVLGPVAPQKAAVSVYSTVRNQVLDGSGMDAGYWVDNLRETVQFSAVIEKLVADKFSVFIEMSPHPVLTAAVNECVEAFGGEAAVIPSLYREKAEAEEIAKNLAEAYRRGCRVNWEAYYGGPAPRVALPAYPMQRERYELDDRSAERTAGGNGQGTHPLLGAGFQPADAAHVQYWQSGISLEQFPYLADHQVNGTPVFPGAGYFEVALAVAETLWGPGAHVIRDLQFKKASLLRPGGPLGLQTKATVLAGTHAHLQFYVRTAGAPGGWEETAEAVLARSTRATVPGLPAGSTPEEFAGRQPVTGAAFYEKLEGLGLQYGPRFRGVAEIVRKGRQVLAKMDTALLGTLATGKYKLHPALLDAAFHLLFAEVVGKVPASPGNATYLVSAGTVQWVREIGAGEPLWVAAHLAPVVQEGAAYTVGADLTLFAGDEQPILHVTGLKAKILRPDAGQSSSGNWLYGINWIKREGPARRGSAGQPATWLVLGDAAGRWQEIAREMQAAGLTPVVVVPGERFARHAADAETPTPHYTLCYGDRTHYQSLVQSVTASHALAGVLHCGGLVAAQTEGSADDLFAAQDAGTLSVLYLLQALNEHKPPRTPRLVIATNGVQRVEAEKDVHVTQASLWGFAKVVANEWPQYECKRIDLGFAPAPAEIGALVGELLTADATERELVLRGDRQYVSRLTPSVHRTEAEPVRFSSEGTYLVTGFRGLGFVFVEWMFERGARHFALLSRSGKASADTTERMRELEAEGATFGVYEADAGDYGQLQRALARIDGQMPALRGVVHAAGLIEPRSLAELTADSYHYVTAPKLKGAWNLHLLTRHLPLDCFVLFSSASALLGLSGQASYVAANAFLDGLAHYRAGLGLPALSVNWGVMKDVGMVADQAHLAKYAEAEGFRPQHMREAIAALETVYGQAPVQVGVTDVDWECMLSYFSTMARTNYLAHFAAAAAPAAARPAEKEETFLTRLRALPAKADRLKALQNHLVEHVAQIIKTTASRVSPSMTFKGLGIDSLMAVQLRNRLEKSLELKLLVTSFWERPTLTEYTAYLEEQTRTAGSVAAPVAAPAPVPPGPALAERAPAARGWSGRIFTPNPRPNAKVKLFCFHDAGGSASLYDAWAGLLDEHIELQLVQLPGRDDLVGQDRYTNYTKLMVSMVPVLLRHLDERPFAFFGHSMGGLIAFEAARALSVIYGKRPVKLYVSATPALREYTVEQLHELNNEQLMNMFPYLRQGESDDFRQELITMLRADLQVISSYRYEPVDLLPTPITVLGAEDDPRVGPLHLKGWENETDSTVQMVIRKGGHRYIERDAHFLTGLLNGDLLNRANG